MEQKKINRKALIIIFSIIALIILTLIIIIKVKDNNKNTNIVETNKSSKSLTQNDNNLLNGTYIYNEDVKYVFDGIGNGSMNHKDEKFIFTYLVKENNLKIDFEDELVHDANYTFELNDSQLKLTGGEGTTGGEYILKKEDE